MKIGTRLHKLLNEQIKNELDSAYLYMSMSNYFSMENLPGFASWMMVQAKEEDEHAMRIYDYLHSRNEEVTLLGIDRPQKKWKSPLDAFKDALAHEKLVTGQINAMVELARKDKDYATDSFLKWFVDEQVEEEASVIEIIEKLKMVGGNNNGLYFLDKELGKRKE